MYTDQELTLLRLNRFVKERLHNAQYRESVAVSVTAWEVPDEPVPFAEAVTQSYEPMEVGQRWGRPWSTLWLHLQGRVPEGWSVDDGQVELVIDLGFDNAKPGFQCEAIVYAPDGRIVKALEPLNTTVPVDVGPGGIIDVYVEAAANPDVHDHMVTWAPLLVGRKSTAGTAPRYTLRRADVALLDVPVWELIQDIWTLEGLALELDPALARRAEIVAALDNVIDAIDPLDIHATAPAGRAALEAVLAKPAHATAHRVYAVGHAHIDSAWLWPVRETIRKCARTFSNVLALMDDDPDFIFACSSAQQFAWMQEHYPELFERIKLRVAEGRFVPVGGMWVESDTNMPGSEALARQFIEGKEFFIKAFGYEPLEVWLPDSFGYTGALPQIAVAAGSNAFLTQKLSWNEVNAFPHSSFEWEGIDGTRILTHFPPVSTYNSDLSGEHLARAQRDHVEKAQSNTSLVPFGWGDGGGGPTREHLAAAKRTRSLEGSPVVTIATPQQFFDRVREESAEPAVWAGELYLEFHRGTYTSQARTKQGNRRTERLLHEAELWATTAAVREGLDYPYADLKEAWHTVLLQQFHDILPGSSIGWVHDQAVENYARVAASLEGLISRSLASLAKDGGQSVAFNSSPFEVRGVPPFAAAVESVGDKVSAEAADGGFVLDNGLVRVVIDSDGLIPSIIDLSSSREVVPAGSRANLLKLFRDTPKQWDAWDVDKEYRRVGVELTEAESVELDSEDIDSASIRIVRRFGSSTIEQVVTINAGVAGVEITTDIDWHERQKLLKLAFPIDVHTTRAASEIQFGHIYRDTHTNTSWDAARFETSAHRWMHIADATFGVAIANDATYGHDVVRTHTAGGKTYSTVSQSLLRAPTFPDPEADQGRHVLRSSIVVGGIAAAVEEGYRLRTPLREVQGQPTTPIVASVNDSVVIETVKLAQDQSGDIVVRLYEAHGGQAQSLISADFDYLRVEQTDLLERAIDDRAVVSSTADTVSVRLDPFQIVTLRFVRDTRAVSA
jgi:alpha-mannosidase